MDKSDGKRIGDTFLDMIAYLEEHYPECTILAIQTTAFIKNKGKYQLINVTDE
jgi:hypothetical protein